MCEGGLRLDLKKVPDEEKELPINNESGLWLSHGVINAADIEISLNRARKPIRAYNAAMYYQTETHFHGTTIDGSSRDIDLDGADFCFERGRRRR